MARPRPAAFRRLRVCGIGRCSQYERQADTLYDRAFGGGGGYRISGVGERLFSGKGLENRIEAGTQRLFGGATAGGTVPRGGRGEPVSALTYQAGDLNAERERRAARQPSRRDQRYQRIFGLPPR